MARRRAVRIGVPGALTCQEVPVARSAVSWTSRCRCSPPSVLRTTCGALSSLFTSCRSDAEVRGSGRVPSRSWSASVEARGRGTGAGAGAGAAPVAGGSAGAWRSEPWAAGTASSTRPTVSAPRANRGRSVTLLTKTPAPSSPTVASRVQPRGLRWPSKVAPNSTW
ncbi:hypothetical protein SCYAM73S_02048 [Streptomyces cyaneofuscatus]